jgi:glutaminase
MDYSGLLAQIADEVAPLTREGKVASYIPELASVSQAKFGMAVYTVEGETYTSGDAHERFSIQSVAKLFAFTLAYQLVGDEIWTRVGREPSGTAFNSLVQLEY